MWPREKILNIERGIVVISFYNRHPNCKFAISRPFRQGLLRQVQQSSLHQVKQSLLRQVQKKIAYFIHPTLMECETPLLRTLYQSSFFNTSFSIKIESTRSED